MITVTLIVSAVYIVVIPIAIVKIFKSFMWPLQRIEQELAMAKYELKVKERQLANMKLSLGLLSSRLSGSPRFLLTYKNDCSSSGINVSAKLTAGDEIK